MENTTSAKVLIKAGVPLALSVAGFIYAKILATKYSFSISSSSKTQENCRSLDVDLSENETERKREAEIDWVVKSIRSLEDLQKKVCELKKQEAKLMGLIHTLLMEVSRVEYFEKECSIIEACNVKLENLVKENMEKIDYLKLKNRVLHRKVKKLSTRKSLILIKPKNLKIKERETEIEIERLCEELEKKNGMIMDLQEQICKLQNIVNDMQEMNATLSKELELANTSSKVEAQSSEDYKKLVNELNQFKAEHEDVVKELVLLKNRGNLIQKFKRCVQSK